MPTAPRVLFLPGAGGDRAFWQPVADRLPKDWETLALDWPGLGDQPSDPSVRGLDDLVEVVVGNLPRPGDLVAQSMGGIVALRVAARYPDNVRRLVLAATSGGFDMVQHRAEDWRQEYRRSYPAAASWITEPVPQERVMLTRVAAPTLLLWGDHDPTSPVTVGQQLTKLLPDAKLRIIPGGTHSFAHDQPELVTPLITAHLSSPATRL